jgi:hypothetical protein
MPRAIALTAVACAFAATACTAAHPQPMTAGAGASATPGRAAASRSARPPPVRGARYIGGGCGATRLLLGATPGWASSAKPPRIRYALAERGGVAGFLFGYPLMARNPVPYSDKILWVVSSSRDGPFHITGHPLGAARPVVSSTWPADSSPGEIYPSEVVVPTPGCWQFTLTWHGHSDAVDLLYVRHR